MPKFHQPAFLIVKHSAMTTKLTKLARLMRFTDSNQLRKDAWLERTLQTSSGPSMTLSWLSWQLPTRCLSLTVFVIPLTWFCPTHVTHLPCKRLSIFAMGNPLPALSIQNKLTFSLLSKSKELMRRSICKDCQWSVHRNTFYCKVKCRTKVKIVGRLSLKSSILIRAQHFTCQVL